MSAIIERFLICDGYCGTNYGVDTRDDSIEKHRRDAKKEGWTFVKGKDYCPDCSKKNKIKTP